MVLQSLRAPQALFKDFISLLLVEEKNPVFLLLETETRRDRSAPGDFERHRCFLEAMASAARPTPEPIDQSYKNIPTLMKEM